MSRVENLAYPCLRRCVQGLCKGADYSADPSLIPVIVGSFGSIVVQIVDDLLACVTPGE